MSKTVKSLLEDPQANPRDLQERPWATHGDAPGPSEDPRDQKSLPSTNQRCPGTPQDLSRTKRIQQALARISQRCPISLVDPPRNSKRRLRHPKQALRVVKNRMTVIMCSFRRVQITNALRFSRPRCRLPLSPCSIHPTKNYVCGGPGKRIYI